MSVISQVVQPSCSLLLSNEPTSPLSSEAICNLDDTEWDKLTRSDMAGKLLEYLDKMYDKDNGMYIFLAFNTNNIKLYGIPKKLPCSYVMITLCKKYL